MSDRTFEDGWRAACESLAATYTDVARDSIELERRENFSNAAAAARFRANEPDTPAPSDAARTETLLDTIYKHDRTKTYEYGEPLRNGTKPGPGQRFLTPRELIEVHRVELARASPPPMETAAVEREAGGRTIREAWTAYCRETGHTQRENLYGWDDLTAWQREASMRMWDAALMHLIECADSLRGVSGIPEHACPPSWDKVIAYDKARQAYRDVSATTTARDAAKDGNDG